MKLHAFRIKNFRSIIDSGFQELSPDGISLFVGQNESGKTSILEGIYAFETGKISVDDIRSGDPLPEITCIYKFENYQEVFQSLPEGKYLPKKFQSVLKKNENNISLTRVWENLDYQKGLLVLENPDFKEIWESVEEQVETPSAADEQTAEELKSSIVERDDFVAELFRFLPLISIFEDTSLLPPTIDLADLVKENTKAVGYEGAKNFLEIAEIELEELQKPLGDRLLGDMLERKNNKVNAELQKYWNQRVGKMDKIEVVLELKNHPDSVDGKQGQPYLTFWIRDNNGRLSPPQRSKGVKWFISFYLKLEATAKTGERIFLIDEPGANLHAIAQKDILSIFEKQKNKLQIIFTTHSPYLLNIDKVYRIHAVERWDTDDEKSETKVIPFQSLGGASIDTLLPLYTNIGVDISHQSIISKDKNVLLEEISAFFYFKAFWKIFAKTEKVNFLPATGCPNLPLLANLMLGWGLSFCVVIDDDGHGRTVTRILKDSLVCNEDKIIRIDGCLGIEDLFSPSDFKSHVLNKDSMNTKKKNSEYMKEARISKVITARDFMIRAENGEIKIDDLSSETKENIQKILLRIIKEIS